MEGKHNRQMGFGDDLLTGRMSGDHWLLKIERLIDWSAFELPLGSLYSHTGRPSHPPLVMFKMLLLARAHRLPVLPWPVADRSRAG
jgi:hypothetical protein